MPPTKNPVRPVLLRCEHCEGFFFGPSGQRFCCRRCQAGGPEPGALAKAERLNAGREAIRKPLAGALVAGWDLFWEVERYTLALRAVTGTREDGTARTRKVFECKDTRAAIRILAAMCQPALARDLYHKTFASKSWLIAGEQARALRQLAGQASPENAGDARPSRRPPASGADPKHARA